MTTNEYVPVSLETITEIPRSLIIVDDHTYKINLLTGLRNKAIKINSALDLSFVLALYYEITTSQQRRRVGWKRFMAMFSKDLLTRIQEQANNIRTMWKHTCRKGIVILPNSVVSGIHSVHKVLWKADIPNFLSYTRLDTSSSNTSLHRKHIRTPLKPRRTRYAQNQNA